VRLAEVSTAAAATGVTAVAPCSVTVAVCGAPLLLTTFTYTVRLEIPIVADTYRPAAFASVTGSTTSPICVLNSFWL
jgi:hypothetical protein